MSRRKYGARGFFMDALRKMLFIIKGELNGDNNLSRRWVHVGF